MSTIYRTNPNPLAWARTHPAAVMALAALAAFATALTLLVATRDTGMYQVWERDRYGVYDQPAATGAVQHCWNTGRTAVNDTATNLWDCDNIKSDRGFAARVQLVQANDQGKPYIYVSTSGSASGPNGAGHVLDRRP